MFWLGMLVMYLIIGIAFALDEIFGNGCLDEWFFYLFTWWIVVLCAPFCLILHIIKNRKKSKKTLTNIK